MVPESIILPSCAGPLAHYPHAKRVGSLVFLSGVSARQPDGRVRGVTLGPEGRLLSNDICEQTRGVLENMQAILAAAGGRLADLVDMSVFLTDMALYKDFNDVYNSFFDAASGPARTTVGVAALPGPHLLVEMKGIAHLPEPA